MDDWKINETNISLVFYLYVKILSGLIELKLFVFFHKLKNNFKTFFMTSTIREKNNLKYFL